jgi:hypothetical protein
MFKDARTNFHDEERSGRPSVVSDDLVQSVDQKLFVKDIASQFGNFLVYFPQISRTVLYEIITVMLGCHYRFCAR